MKIILKLLLVSVILNANVTVYGATIGDANVEATSDNEFKEKFAGKDFDYSKFLDQSKSAQKRGVEAETVEVAPAEDNEFKAKFAGKDFDYSKFLDKSKSAQKREVESDVEAPAVGEAATETAPTAEVVVEPIELIDPVVNAEEPTTVATEVSTTEFDYAPFISQFVGDKFDFSKFLGKSKAAKKREAVVDAAEEASKTSNKDNEFKAKFAEKDFDYSKFLDKSKSAQKREVETEQVPSVSQDNEFKTKFDGKDFDYSKFLGKSKSAQKRDVAEAEPVEAVDELAVAEETSETESGLSKFIKYADPKNTFNTGLKYETAEDDTVDAEDSSAGLLDGSAFSKFVKPPKDIEALKNPVQKDMESFISKKRRQLDISGFINPPAAIDVESLKNPIQKEMESLNFLSSAKKRRAFDFSGFVAPAPGKKFDFMKLFESAEEKETEDDIVTKVVPKKESKKAGKFLPLVSKIFAAQIKACKSPIDAVKFECPATTDGELELYRHDPCSCNGYTICHYNDETNELEETDVDACDTYQPYNNVANVCIKKAKTLKSTHPTLARACDMQFSLYQSLYENEGSGSDAGQSVGF